MYKTALLCAKSPQQREERSAKRCDKDIFDESVR